jgi:DNA repair protein RecO (recombination protein O)
MRIETEAIVVGVRGHGEHGAVVRILTREHGMLAGYVRGGRSRQLRPVLVAGNTVRADLRARTDTQLAALTVELIHGRAGLMTEPLAAAALEWTTALVAVSLPEGQPYPRVHAALDGVLTAIESAPSARGWATALMRYEAVVLAELGYGTDAEPAADQATVIEVLAANGRRLAADLLVERRAAPLAARERLVERLARALD